MLVYVLFTSAFLAYLLAGSLYTKQFFSHSSKVVKVAQLALMLALASHLGLLIVEAHSTDGQRLSLSYVASMLACLVTLTIFITNRFIKNLIFLPVVSFVSAAAVLISVILPNTTGITVQMNAAMITHILLSLIAYGVLSISMLYACQLAYINYQLKHKKRIMLTGTLPPLMSVEKILYQLMSYGAIMLIIALVTGFLFVPNMFADGYAHKTLLSSLSVVVYVACIVLHHFVGLRARVTVILNLIGLSLLTLGYFGSRLVQELLLR